MFAWALLAFPEAPLDFRRGLLRILDDEQRHTRMYIARVEDAGARFFEMLAAQLTPPWMVLRIISAIMDKPTERYLAESELGGFPERVMAEIDDALKAISKLDLDRGPEAGRAAGRLVELITRQTFELEVCIEITRDHGWGHRIFGQKKTLANLVEARLREADKLTTSTLPMESSGFSRPRRPGRALSACRRNSSSASEP